MTPDEMQLRSAIADRLKEERLRLRLTPEQLGQRGGVHRSSVFNYEAGVRVPDAVFLALAVASAGLDAQYVVTGARARSVEGLAADERMLLDRFSQLPPHLKEHIETATYVALMAQAAERQVTKPEATGPRAKTTIKGDVGSSHTISGDATISTTIGALKKVKKGR